MVFFHPQNKPMRGNTHPDFIEEATGLERSLTGLAKLKIMNGQLLERLPLGKLVLSTFTHVASFNPPLLPVKKRRHGDTVTGPRWARSAMTDPGFEVRKSSAR